MTTKSVTILGLGPMGQAMVSAYLPGGYAVTVRNRTLSFRLVQGYRSGGLDDH